MRLRTFTAATMQAALAEVKEALGDDALILSSVEKKDGVTITAAIDPDDSPTFTTNHQPSTTNHFSTDQIRYDVQAALRFHNVPELFISKIAATLSDAAIAGILGQARMNIANESRHFLRLALEHACGRYLQFSPPAGRPLRAMLVGAPGIGKTLTIAKLATRQSLAGEKTVVVTTDTSRAGGAAQLKSFTDILGVPLTVCPDRRSLDETLKLVGRDSHLLIDTAGCNPYDEAAMAELSGLVPDHTDVILAMPSGMDAQEAIDMAEMFAALSPSCIAATRTDCTRRMGGLLAAASAHRLPLGLATDSSSVADNITPMSAKTLVQYLIKPL